MEKKKLFLGLVVGGCSLLLSSCNSYQIGVTDMSKIKGTYQLSIYNITEIKDADNKDDKYYPLVNAIKAYDVTCYIVITGEEKGYYLYQDSIHSYDIEEIDLTYEYDTEKTDKVRYVEYTNSAIDSTMAENNVPHGSKERLGVCFNIFGKNLNRNTTTDSKETKVLDKTLGKKSKIKVKYKKVSKDTTTSYIRSKVNLDKK